MEYSYNISTSLKSGYISQRKRILVSEVPASTGFYSSLSYLFESRILSKMIFFPSFYSLGKTLSYDDKSQRNFPEFFYFAPRNT